MADQGDADSPISLDALWALFRRIDKSRDGKVSRSELSRARKRGDLTLTLAETKALLRFADEDDNGNKELAFAAFYHAMTGQMLDHRMTPGLLKVFTQLDTNNDGYLTKRDLERAGQNGIPLTDKEIRLILSRGHMEGDQQRVSLSEYTSVFGQTVKLDLTAEQEAEYRAQFALLDFNGDGYISKLDLRKSAANLQIKQRQILETFQQADTNGDGQISFDEFVKLMRS